VWEQIQVQPGVDVDVLLIISSQSSPEVGLDVLQVQRQHDKGVHALVVKHAERGVGHSTLLARGVVLVRGVHGLEQEPARLQDHLVHAEVVDTNGADVRAPLRMRVGQQHRRCIGVGDILPLALGFQYRLP
jgi:hypothetical protein